MFAFGKGRIRLTRALQSVFRTDRDDRIQRRVVALDVAQISARELLTGDGSVSEVLSQLRDRSIEECGIGH